MENTLFFGDNLSVLKGHDGQGQPYFPEACVDLIYLDPPFNSNRSYNVLFKEEHGAQPPARITAFRKGGAPHPDFHHRGTACGQDARSAARA